MLESAAVLEVPAGLDWELLVVDNGSTDDTSAVVSEFAARLPLRCVVEPVPGLSNARNRGVTEARGALILWTDDDVALDRHWLSAYVEAGARFPQAGFFGGNILPFLEEPVTDWFAEYADHPRLAMLMAHRRYQEPPVALTAETLPFGANFAVRGDLQRQRSFDARLGVSPTHSRSGEETNLLHQLMASGAYGMSVPAASVRHYIQSSRQSLAYFRRYFAAQGETWALVRTHPGFAMAPKGTPASRLMLAGVPGWAVRNLVRAGALVKWAELTGNRRVWIENASEYEHLKAAIKFIYKSRKAQ
jgi:glycosyltransferase involved in cell wall biosynthesis